MSDAPNTCLVCGSELPRDQEYCPPGRWKEHNQWLQPFNGCRTLARKEPTDEEYNDMILAVMSVTENELADEL